MKMCSMCGIRPRYVAPGTGKADSRCRECVNKRTAEINKRKRAAGVYFDPDKQPAREALNRAVRAGLIVRGTCALCHDPRLKTDGHHHDYDQPFNVTWLCRTCHWVVDQVLEHRKASPERRKALDAWYPVPQAVA